MLAKKYILDIDSEGIMSVNRLKTTCTVTMHCVK